jgi:protocatechuate 3,4-dioxygenase beta subunit
MPREVPRGPSRRLGMLGATALLALLGAVAYVATRGSDDVAPEPATTAKARPRPGRVASSPSEVSAATGSLHGVVVAGEDDVPVESCVIRLRAEGGAERQTTSDAWGRFAFEDVPANVPHDLAADGGCATERAAGVRVLPGERRDVGRLDVTPGTPFRVVVRDERGGPVAGATVSAYREDLRGVPDRGTEFLPPRDAEVPVATVTTGAEGVATFQLARRLSFAATAPGRARTVRRWNRDEVECGEMTLVVRAVAPLRGRVVDADGAPVAGARVVARVAPRTWDTYHGSREEMAGLCEHVRADAEGRFALATLPAGTIEIAVARADGWPVEAAVVVTPGVDEVEVPLPPVGTVEGRVADAAGAPVAGASVHVLAGNTMRFRTAVSAGDGTYRLEDLPVGDDATVVASPPRGWTAVRGVRLGVGVELASGSVARADFVMGPAATVEGVVTRDGVPIVGAEVELVSVADELSDSRWWGDARTDARGRYQVDDAVPGPTAVFASLRGTRVWEARSDFFASLHEDPSARARHLFEARAGAVVRRDVEVTSGSAETDLDVARRMERTADEVLGGGRVRFVVRVTTADGAPLAVPQMSLHRDFGAGRDDSDVLRWARPMPTDGVGQEDERVSDEDRSFVVAAFDLNHDLVVRHVEVPPDATEMQVDLVLPTLPVLRARVVCAGAPVAGAEVFRGRVLAARSAADGTFALRARSGTVPLAVAARGCVRRMVDDVEVPREEVLEIELLPERALSGVVVDASGAPVRGVRVVPLDGEGQELAAYAGSVGNAALSAVTDAEGRFRLREVPEGELWIRIESATAGVRVATQTFMDVDAAQALRLVARTSANLGGRVVDAAGRPVEHATVECNGVDASTELEVPREVRTDAEGRFRFEGLLSGEYEVDVRPTEHTGLAPARRRTKGGPEDVEFRLERAGVLTGTVYELDGTPHTTVGIEATRLDRPAPDEGPWHLDLEDVTDRQGAFRILVPARGRYRLGFVRRYVRFEQEVLRGGEEVAPGGPHLELRAVPR